MLRRLLKKLKVLFHPVEEAIASLKDGDSVPALRLMSADNHDVRAAIYEALWKAGESEFVSEHRPAEARARKLLIEKLGWSGQQELIEEFVKYGHVCEASQYLSEDGDFDVSFIAHDRPFYIEIYRVDE